MKMNNEKALFSKNSTGRDMFRTILSMKQTLMLLACLRFYNKIDK